MHLMRIGAPGAGKPGARFDDNVHVDLTVVARDFDEVFVGGHVFGPA